MATIVASVAGGNWDAAAAWVGGVPPTSADDAQLDATSGNITITAAAAARSLDCTGYTGTFTHGAFTLTIGDATAGLGNVALIFVAGMTYTKAGASSTINLVSTAATQQTLSMEDKDVGNFKVTTGNYIAQSGITMPGSTSFTMFAAVTWDMNGQIFTVLSTNGSKRTWDGGGKTYDQVNVTIINTTITIGGANTMSGLAVTGNAAQGNVLALSGNQTVSGTLSVAGNSATQRVLVRSIDFLQVAVGEKGTPRTLTAATVTMSNVDFQDIIGAGAGSWNLAAITGNSGDCGGNSGITFTTPATQTATGTASFTWSTHGWTSRVPLPQDDVVINNAFVAGRVITADMARLGKNISYVGMTGTPALTYSRGVSIFGSLTYIADMILSATTQTVTFEGRGTHTLTSAGHDWAAYTAGFDCVGGSYTLQDALSTAAKPLQIVTGTVDFNDFNVTATNISVTNSTLVNLSMGNGTITLSGSGTMFNLNAAPLPTINAEGSTILFTSVSASSTSWFTGDRVWNNVEIVGGVGYGNFLFRNAGSTFNQVKINDPRVVEFEVHASSVFNITDLITTATFGSAVTLRSTVAASTARLTTASPLISIDWCTIQDLTVLPVSTWYAGANSTDVSNNVNWIFTAPPAPPSVGGGYGLYGRGIGMGVGIGGGLAYSIN